MDVSPQPEVCVECPRCKSREVMTTVASYRGAYCRCKNCGHLWHDDAEKSVKGKG